ncbi:MAG: hypothetical protein QOK42_1467 [Frankiaceae bacterium]|jgi:DNA repair photolyase|nr:hypothetical protein [Frankiaceae bacterium]
MRWDGQTDAGAPLALIEQGAVTRRFDTPRFQGMEFYEVHARSVLNRVPDSSPVPFRWTVNPYRGCSHACTYCFARSTHSWLDLSPGLDFDRRVVVKVNAPEVLRRELARPRWARERVALGTNVDPYQRVEGRYRLMPGIIEALRDSATPFSILTKGTLILRDLELLAGVAQRVRVEVAMSIGSIDPDVWRATEPGTPSPARRLEAVSRMRERGLRPTVLCAPLIPGLSDSREAIEATVRACADAGAVKVTGIPLHLRPGAREWFLERISDTHPQLLPRLRQLYRRGAYAPADYRREIGALVASAARRHGVHRDPEPVEPGPTDRAAKEQAPEQLSLL